LLAHLRTSWLLPGVEAVEITTPVVVVLAVIAHLHHKAYLLELRIP
jgi:hypothetical protein